MSLLEELFGAGPLSPYLRLLAILGVTHLLVIVVRSWLVARLGRLVRRSKTRADDILVAGLSKLGLATTLGVLAYSSVWVLELPGALERFVPGLGAALLFLQAGLCLDRALVEVATVWRTGGGDDPEQTTVAAGLAVLLRALLWSLVSLLMLANLGVEVSALLAGLGIGGIAAALAIRAALSDVIAAIAIYFDRPFDLGDFIVVGENMGSVERIGLRSTQIRALTGEQLIFSNTDLTASRIQNFRRMHERRVVVRFGVVYDTPHAQLRDIPGMIQHAVEETEHARFERCHFADYGDSALIFELVFWIGSPDYNVYMDAQQTIYLAIHQRFEEAGVSFAFPTQTVHVHQTTHMAA